MIPFRHISPGLLKNKKLFLTAVCLCITATLLMSAHQIRAESVIYEWTGRDGVIHVTDDITKVPAEYWESGSVREEKVKQQPEQKPTGQKPQPVVIPKDSSIPVYGDYPVDWWTYKFRTLKKDISDSENRLQTEKTYVATFDKGRRLGQIYTDEEISVYEGYVKEIPVIEEKLGSLKAELEELQRKATIYGVPREIRE